MTAFAFQLQLFGRESQLINMCNIYKSVRQRKCTRGLNGMNKFQDNTK